MEWYNLAMVSLDFRTRTDDDIATVDTRAFFETQLPDLIATNGHFAAAGAHELGVAPFSIVTPAGEWTLAMDGGTFTLEPGTDGAAIVNLTDEDIADFVNDLKTPMTLLTGGRLDMPRGNLGNFLDWWVVLRALIDARPVHTRGAITFRDRDGAPLDLHRAFTPEDDDADLAHFLAEAGFLHLRGWFDPDDMAAISVDMDTARPTYTAMTGARGGRAPPTAATTACACSRSNNTRRRPAPCSRRTVTRASAGSLTTTSGCESTETRSRRS